MKTYEHIAIWHIHKSTYYNTFSQYMVTQAFWWMHINQTEDHHFCKGWTSCSIIREPTMSFSHSPALFSFTLATMKYRKGAPLNPSRIQTNPVPCHTLDVTNTTSFEFLCCIRLGLSLQSKEKWCERIAQNSTWEANFRPTIFGQRPKNGKDRTGVQIRHRPPPMNRKLWTKGHFFFRPSGTCTANFFGNFDKFLLQTVPKERHLGQFWEKVFCLALCGGPK